jgi:4'-phosphopantetheinyl transferase
MTANDSAAHDEGDRALVIGAESCELWLVDLEASSAALAAAEAATPRLSDEDSLRWEKMTDAARHERRLAHIALRVLLERSIGPAIRRVPFVRSSTGKPALPNAGGIGFSLAHASRFALIAIGPEPLGVDIEGPRPVRIPAARRLPIERAAVALAGGRPLAGGDDDARLLSAWVRLEAVAKARGEGLAPVLEQLRPDSAIAAGTSDMIEALGRGIVAHDVEAPAGHFAAVALGAGRHPGAPRALPATRDGVAALLAGADGTKY